MPVNTLFALEGLGVASRYPGAATCARGCGVTTSLRQGARDAHYPFGVHRGCGRGEARCTRWVAMHPIGRGASHTDRVQCRRQQVESRARALKGAQGRASGGAFIRRGRARARLGRDDLVEGHLAVEGAGGAGTRSGSPALWARKGAHPGGTPTTLGARISGASADDAGAYLCRNGCPACPRSWSDDISQAANPRARLSIGAPR